MSSAATRVRSATRPEARRAISADGTPIVFDFYRSSGRLGVIIVPGFWRTRRYITIRSIATRIAAELAPCAVIDLRGHGDSGGTFEFDRFEPHDVVAVARMFCEEARLDGLVLLGLSAGGAIAISTAAHDSELPIRGLLLVSPVGEFTRVIPRPNPFTIHRHISLDQAISPPRFRWPGSDRLSPLEDARKLATLPVTIVHTRNDWLVSHRHGEAIARCAGNATLQILDVPGRYHADRLFDVAGDSVWPIVDAFIRRFAAVPARQLSDR